MAADHVSPNALDLPFRAKAGYKLMGLLGGGVSERGIF